MNDAAFPGVTGWAVPKDFCASFIDTETACSSLAERGLRRIAARGWTTPDGVHTMVWLLQFPDQSAASYADTTLPAPMHTFSDVQAFDGPGPEAMVWGVGSTAATPGKTVPIAVYKTVLKADGSSAGALTGRFAHVALGDTVEVVETQGPKSVPETPTDQIVMLQAELLR